jgi:hypothetical protein
MHEGDHGILDDLEPDDLRSDDHDHVRESGGNRRNHPGSRLSKNPNAEILIKILSGAIVAALIGAFLFLRFL